MQLKKLQKISREREKKGMYMYNTPPAKSIVPTTFVSASNLRKSDFKIINNMQWLNSFAFDNKSRSSRASFEKKNVSKLHGLKCWKNAKKWGKIFVFSDRII